MVSFLFQQYNVQYPLNRGGGGVSGLQNLSQHFAEHNNYFPLPVIKLLILGCPACSPVILFWLSSVHKINA